jgi:predicted small metal-binding protein
MGKARKILECGTVTPGCRFVAHGESEDEIMMIIADHARAMHDVEHMSEQLKAKIRASIRDADDPRGA